METAFLDSTNKKGSRVGYGGNRQPLGTLNANRQLRELEMPPNNSCPRGEPATTSQISGEGTFGAKRTKEVFVQSKRAERKSPVEVDSRLQNTENRQLAKANKTMSLKHKVRVSRIIKHPPQTKVTRESVSPFQKSHLKILQKSVKKLILEPQVLNESEIEKVRRMSRPRSVNEKLKKIVVNQCNIVKTKQMPTHVYQKLIQDAERKRASQQHAPAPEEELPESCPQADIRSEAFQDSLVQEIMKKSIFSNHNSVKKSEIGRNLKNEFEGVIEFQMGSDNQRKGPPESDPTPKTIPSDDLSISEVKRLRLSAHSQPSCKSRNSSYKIVKKELEISAKMSLKQRGRLNHDLRAFQVRAEPTSPGPAQDQRQLVHLNEALLKTMPAAPVDHRQNFFYSPSKSNRDLRGSSHGNQFVELRSKSNSVRRNETFEPYQPGRVQMEPSGLNLFDEPETPKTHQMQVAPEMLNFDELPLRQSKKFRTGVSRRTAEEGQGQDDPVLLLQQLESDFEQLKSLKKRTASHTPTRNQRMIYRQILNNLRPPRKEFKPRNKSAIKGTRKRAAKTGPRLRKNYSKKVSDTSKKPRKNTRRADAKKKGLSKYCSMKYAALQLKNQQNLLEDLLQSCQHKFKQLDRNITELENKREVEFERNRKTVDPGRGSKYYSKFTEERSKKAKPGPRPKGARRTTGKPRKVPSKLKINQIFRDLTKSINPKTPKMTGIPRGRYKKKKATF